MCDRDEMLDIVRKAYAARVRGDVEEILRVFTRDAVFRLNAAPFNRVTAVHAISGHELRDAMAQLIDNFEFSDFEIVDSVVENSKAAVRSMFTVRQENRPHRPDGGLRPDRVQGRKDMFLRAFLRHRLRQ